MNTVNYQKALPPVTNFERGDILSSPYSGELYILAHTEVNSYVPISLSNGNRYRQPSSTLNDAAEGFKLFKRNATVTVS